ncbi:T9SS type A sorting domain-containing protein [Hymenobacter sp. B81]|uniref:T9SS type A sorting domain-containing protein n=1 Tax=Hymenobacter sp. B81 TaxID=3344878 RepID=UPI0037DD289E
MKALFSLAFFLFDLIALSYAQPTWQWARQAPITYTGVATDPTGHVYVTGSFSGTITLGSTTLTSHGYSDLLVAKFAPDGRLRWARQMGGTQASARGAALTLDAIGNCYLTGSFQGRLDQNTAGSVLTSPEGWPHILVARFTPEGKLSWVRQAGGDGYANDARAIAVDALGNCVITGTLSGTQVRFGQLSFSFPLRQQLFVARYNTQGVPQWVNVVRSNGFTSGSGIGLDALGDCYVVGNTIAPITIDGVTYGGPNQGRTVVAKFGRQQGRAQWVRLIGSPAGAGTGESISVDPGGTCYLSGSYTGAATFGALSLSGGDNERNYVARYTRDGQASWVQELSTATAGAASRVQLAPDYRSLVVLSTAGSSAQTRVSGLQTDGTPTWSTAVTGAGQSWGYCLAVGLSQQVYLAGALMNTCQFGSQQLTGTPDGSFLARLSLAGANTRANPVAGSTQQLAALYPNPARQQVTLTTPSSLSGQALEATLYNRFGRAVLTQRLSPAESARPVSLALTGLPAGLYTLRLSGGGQLLSQQLAVE